MAQIETSADRSRGGYWTRERIEERIAATRRRKGTAYGRRLDREHEERVARALKIPAKFPAVAKRGTTRPAFGNPDETLCPHTIR